MKDKKTVIMAMNCKQFKHTERVEKKQQYSFNPAEVIYENTESDDKISSNNKATVRDLSLKKILLYFVATIFVASILKSLFFN